MAESRIDVTARLAEFAVGFDGGAISPAAIEQVPKALLDLVGVTVIGFTEPAGQLIRRYVLSEGGSGPATLLGGAARVAPTMAALANGTAGHAFDFDDIGVRAGHVSVAIMPAALAVAELADVSGRTFSDAMVIGYEVANRLTRLFDDPVAGPYERGYHKPSVYAVFGGVAAAGRLLGLDTVQMRHAFGIAASQSGGLRINFGTMTKPMHAGVACRTAVEAVLLARDGFTASDVAIEGRFGWYDVVCLAEGELARVVDGLGESFAIEEGLRFKLYPSCGANHSSIQVVLDVLRENDLATDSVEAIEVAVDPRNLDEVLVYPWPRSGLEGKFSLAYNVAGALVDRAVTVHTFADSEIPRLEAVRSRITTRSDPTVPRDGSVVTVRVADGRVIIASVDTPRGNVDSPLIWSDLVAKFAGNVGALLRPDVADEIAEAAAKLNSLDSVAELTHLLTGSTG